MKNDTSRDLEEALSLLSGAQGEEFADEFEKSVKEALIKTNGENVAKVESAIPLTAEEKSSVCRHIEKVLKRKMEFEFITNNHLLGGFAVSVGDWRLDASLVKQLEHLRNDLES